MARIIVLDAGPLGLASQAPGIVRADNCRRLIRDLDAASISVVAPEIADYEVRRELLRLGATAGLRRLDRLVSALFYDPITTPAMRLAAEYLVAGKARRIADGGPAGPGCRLYLGGPGDVARRPGG